MASDGADDEHLRRELLREAETMALYIAVTLLAALAALPDERVEATLGGAALIWATAAGLALVHWLTFDLAGSVLHSTRLDRLHRLTCPVTLGAALVVRRDGGSVRRALAGGLAVLAIGAIVVTIKLTIAY